jgi:tetratricopeptide (TPR) repeat protein
MRTNADTNPAGGMSLRIAKTVMQLGRASLLRTAITLSLLTWPAISCAAAAICEPWVARLVSVQGSVDVRRTGQTQWQPGRLDETYCAGDMIRVREHSRAAVVLRNDVNLRLDQNTTVTFIGLERERTSLVDLLLGTAYFFSRIPRSLRVTTPFVNAAVEGTEFFVKVERDQTSLSIFEGHVSAANQAGSLALTSGQSAVARAGEAPTPRVVVRPRDAVQWALYYPPILDYRPADFANGAETDWRAMVRKSLQFYREGDLAMAFAAIAGVPEGVRDPRFFTYRAVLLLTVGRVDEARADIDRALALDPRHSPAVAVRSVIAVAQNDKGEALRSARTAVELDPTSAAARVALSYAQQADFDLEGALASLQEAVNLAPDNALAWARLAELWLSFGELRRALKAANQAVKLQPALARTQTVLGFAYLTQIRTREARQAFEKAIQMDQADPLPRLGLGLAKIRVSGLAEGREDIEIAVSLDPNNSLMRSYLGKAYFEEKRPGLDERQYAVAKELDPKDPTPWFYDAIAKQTTNRPVEALHNLQQAIELNDNRAVYRSRLLLDADLAARSAGLARIYSDLGFQQLALVEGWKSVNTDPTNFSAHRFLADSYAVLPRHEIARVSELLQSQLLQPLNLTPIQPRLAESNLFLISAQGPGALSFNEFNPLFTRDRLTLQVSGLGGEQDTWAGEGVLAGLYRNASFSLGGSHFTTDGFRKNADQRDDIANAFVQLELSPQTSLLSEYRYRRTEQGDLRLRFFPDAFSPSERFEVENHTIRLGGRHAFSPGSLMLGSLSYQDSVTILRDDQPPDPQLRFSKDKSPEKAFSAELQHLFRSRYFNLTSGAGFFHIDGNIQSTSGLVGPPPQDVSSTIDTPIRHVNAYAYGYINLLKDVTLTVGTSVDSLSDDFLGEDTTQFNPKFGVMWNPFAATTVRAAVFRTVRRTLITEQTLEPTQVAGFNQFFDDFNLTKTWRYGVAIDQKFSRDVFGGVEVARRELKIPFLDFRADPANPPTGETDWNEDLGRAYLFWTPHPWLAFRAEYVFERFKRDEEAPADLTELNSHRVPLGIGVFHPSGLSASLTATYFNQEGDFTGVVTTGLRSDRDEFWTIDAAINYRLPKRWGFITVGATNLFDTEFKFFDADLNNASIHPVRTLFARVTLAWP